MRILVLGGTGFMGKPLCQMLATQGHDLAVFSRGENKPDLPAGAVHIKGDRFDLSAVAPEIDSFGAETLIDMFAMTAKGDLPVFEFFSERVGRYVMISSCDVYRSMGRILGTEPGPIIEGLVGEDGPLREELYPYRELMDHTGGGNYDKIPLETACLKDYAFEGTVLRLPMVYGPDDRQHRFRDMVKHMADARPAILFPEASANWTSTYGYVDNVAAGIALAATHEAAIGEVFNIADVNDLPQKGWAGAIADQMKWRGEVVAVRKEDLPEKRAAMAAGGNFRQDLRIDATKIQNLLGFVAPVDFETALQRMIAYEMDHLEEVKAEAFDYEADDAFLAKYGQDA